MTATQEATARCTSCARSAGLLIPWAGERLCQDCADTQLDLLAMAAAQARVTIGGGVRTPGHVQRVVLPRPDGIDTDALAEAIVAAVLEWAGGDTERLRFAEELLSRTPLLEGSAK